MLQTECRGRWLTNLMFATSRSAGVYIPSGTESVYPKFTLSGNAKYDALIKNAYHNGIWLTSAEDVTPDKEITMKEFAAYVLEFDGFSGFHHISVISSKNNIDKNAKIRADFGAYPKNESDYRVVLNSLSNDIYEAPYKSAVSLPKDSYELSNSYRMLLTSMFSSWVRLLSSVGYELEVTYYPALVVNDGNGYTSRVSIKFVSVPANSKLGDLINCVSEFDGSRFVNSGDVIVADIATGKKINNLTMDINDMVLSQIIK